MAKINTTFSYQDGITQGLNRLIKTLKGVEQTLKGTENGLKGANPELEKTHEAAKKAEGGLSSLTEKLLKFNLIVDTFHTVKGAINGVTGAVGGLNAMWQEQQNAEARLGAVMEARMGATKAGIADMTSYLDTFSKGSAYSKTMLTNAAQELGTYVEKADTLKGLLPMLTSMAQQAGVTNEQGLMSMATMIGKVMGGAMGGLSDRGWVFSAEEKEAFKAMNETERLNFLTKTAADNFKDMDSAITAMMANLAQQKHLEDLQIKLGGLFNSFFDAVGRAQIAIQTEFLERIVPIVERISPVFDQMVVWVTNSTTAIHSAIDTLVERVQNAKMRIQNAIEGYRIAEIIVPMIDEIREKFGSLASAVQSALSAAFEIAVHTVVNIIKTIRQVYDGFYNVMDGIQKNLDTIAQAVLISSGIIVSAVIAIGVAYLWTSRTAISAYITHLRRGIVIALMHAKASIAAALASAAAWLAANWHILLVIAAVVALIAILMKLCGVANVLGAIFGGAFGLIKTVIIDAFKTAYNAIFPIINVILGLGESIYNAFTNPIGALKNVWYTFINGLLDMIAPFASIIDSIVGTKLVTGLNNAKAAIEKNQIEDLESTGDWKRIEKLKAWETDGIVQGTIDGAKKGMEIAHGIEDKIKNLKLPSKKDLTGDNDDGVDKEGKSVEDMIKDALDDKFQTDGTGALKTSDKGVIEISADYKELLTSAATRRFNATFKNVAPSVSVGTVVMNNGADKDKFISDLETALKNVAENDLAS